jgi:hypothetical protein
MALCAGIEHGRYREMTIRKTLMAVLALAIAIAFAPLSSLQAATLAGPDTKVSTLTLTQTVAMKGKHTHKMRHKGKHAKSKGPGRCGTLMYWSKKGHHCMDARKK